MPTNSGAAQRLQTRTLVCTTVAPDRTVRLAGSIETSIFTPLGAEPLTDRNQPIGSLGQLVVTPNGSPIRSIITGRRRIVTGSYASRKARRAFPFEGMNERAFFMHSEVDTNVVDYRAQPFRFEFVLDGQKRVYIADCVRLLADGSIEVIEVKNDQRALRDLQYASKIERVWAICAALGWTFRVVLRQQLISPAVRYANIVEVQSRRHTRFDASHEYVARHALDRAGGQLALGEFADALGERQRGMAIAQAMMVGRLLDIDLTDPLSPNTLVRTAGATATLRAESI